MTDRQDWWRRAVFYQVYPRSFMDGDGDGVGDLDGVLAQLAYVADLGVEAIWLSPFFRSPMRDFGYDVSDYCDVDPLFGDLAAFDRVRARAHALGLKLIIDQVWSHTSDRHSWFLESAASREGPKSDWYVWADAKPDGSPPNNWQASFGGPSWTWSPQRRQYYLHNFLPSQPDLNYWNPQVQDAILDVARFWLDRGVDGFRLDVINYLVHDRDLRDNPPAGLARTPPLATMMQRHVEDRSRPETLAFIARLRALLDTYGDRMAVGEIFDDDMLARQREYTDGPDRLHTAYSFFLLHARSLTPTLVKAALEAWDGATGWPSWSLSNHDVARYPTRLAQDEPKLTRTLFALLLCLRGSPFLYQGDELGLPQAHVPFELLQDPFAIAAYAGESFRDGARTPMPWRADDPNAGFSRAERTWLPLDPRHAALAVDAQANDPGSMLAFAKRMLALRKAEPALQTGSARWRDLAEGVAAFERTQAGATLLCVFELSGTAHDLDLAALAAALACDGLGGASLSGRRLTLPPHGFALARMA